MEYTIGSIQRGNLSHLILKTKNEIQTDLNGRVTLEQKKGNTIIRDTFTIIYKYHSEESSDGYVYDWYYISDHYKHEDRTEEVRSELEQNITDLEIDAIEQDQELTDHDIAIMELQEQVNGLIN